MEKENRDRGLVDWGDYTIDEFGEKVPRPSDKFTDKDIEYLRENKSTFNKDTEMTELLAWVGLLNEPWGQRDAEFYIHVDAASNYDDQRYSDPDSRFICEYECIGYDDIMSKLYGYGADELSAFIDCKNNLDMFNEINEQIRERRKGEGEDCEETNTEAISS